MPYIPVFYLQGRSSLSLNLGHYFHLILSLLSSLLSSLSVKEGRILLILFFKGFLCMCLVSIEIYGFIDPWEMFWVRHIYKLALFIYFHQNQQTKGWRRHNKSKSLSVLYHLYKNRQTLKNTQ